MEKFITWFDVETVIFQKMFAGDWPKGLIGVSVYPTKVRARISSATDEVDLSDKFSSWFGPRYDKTEGKIYLEFSMDGTKRFLDVQFDVEPHDERIFPENLKPNFASFSLYPAKEGIPLKGPDINKMDGLPSIWAFYSFKGGVGRTLHLVSLVKALSELKPLQSILIVDADLEAPGLTWWAQEILGHFEFSFLDFLALAHYDNSPDYSEALKITVENLRQQMLLFDGGGINTRHFFLPSFRNIDQLMRMPIRPENLCWESGKEWLIPELLGQLGKALGVAAVVVDLRAGLSEISSSFLFDSRVQRLIVTTPAGQSIEGTTCVLEQIKKVSSLLAQHDEDYDAQLPTVILSMIPEKISAGEACETAREKLRECLTSKISKTDELLGKDIFYETYYDEDLLHLKNLNETLNKLIKQPHSIHSVMSGIALYNKSAEEEQDHEVVPPPDTSDYKAHLTKLTQIAKEYEYAESGSASDFLITQSLKNLARPVPVAVIMGSKGAGKTYTYLQLAQLKQWNKFLQKVGASAEPDYNGFILPLLTSKNLGEKAETTIRECREDSPYYKGNGIPFKENFNTEIEDLIEKQKLKGNTDLTTWREFWLQLMARSLFCENATEPLRAMQEQLAKTNNRVIFLFDGLEMYFQDIGTNAVQQADRKKVEVQQVAVQALCQSMVEAVRAWPGNRIGLLIFVRKDIVQSAIKQNFGQFEALYRSFALTWGKDEALRLVAWLVKEGAKLSQYVSYQGPIENISGSALEEILETLWGKKMGRPNSKEAYTPKWVMEALSDYNQQLEARDLIRLIHFAAKNAKDLTPFPDRLLPPYAIRKALTPCSESKISEIEDEIPVLKPIFKKLAEIPQIEKIAPFSHYDFKLNSEEIDVMTKFGIIKEVKGKYQFPEIIRRGLESRLKLTRVASLLGIWMGQIRFQNAIDFYDINRIAVNVAEKLLNLIFDLHLIDLNAEQHNYPGVDIGDISQGLTFQITTENSAKKVKDILIKFMAGPGKDSFQRVCVLIIDNKKPKVNRTKLQQICPFFVPDRDLFSMTDLARIIADLRRTDPNKFQQILAYLEQEFGPGNVRDNRAMLREKSREFYDNLRGPNGRFKHLQISELILPRTKTEWLPTRATVNTSVSTQNEAVSEVLASLWQEKIRHAVVMGEGGMGKTVNLILWWQKLLEQTEQPVPIYIALNEFNQVPAEERHHFILSYVLKNYTNTNLTLSDIEKTLSTLPPNSPSHPLTLSPSFLFLLDGFNEITVEKQQLLVELTWLREMCPTIQLVVTSRYDMREVCQWADWNLVTLLPLSVEHIHAYLPQGTVLPTRLKGLLGNPMMLTLYAVTCDVQQEFGDSDLYRFKPQVESTAELLWNFMEAQVAKLPERLGHNKQEIAYYTFLLRFLLPALGLEMEKMGLFDFTREQMTEVLERVCSQFASPDFFTVFPEYLKYRKYLPVGASVDLLDSMERDAHLKDTLSQTLCMMVEEGASFRFLHQNFRIFFAAVAVWNQILMGLHKREIPFVLKERPLSFFVRRMVGELAGEFRHVPRCVPGEGWSYVSESRTLLSDILELCRGLFGERDREKVGYAVWNILTIWKELSGELCGVDLSQLDLSAITFNGVRCSRYGDGHYLAADFNGSRLHEKNLLPQGHTDWVNSAVYGDDVKKILSASDDCTIKEWDVASGACLSTLTGHTSAVTSAVYSYDGKKILSASSDHTIKEWDVASGACLATLTGHSDGVTSAVYSYDGKKILSASSDHTIKEWDVASGACLATISEHSHVVTSAVYSSDGEKILSTSSDHTIKEWAVASGVCLSTLTGHSDWVTSAVYSYDGKKILSASNDHTIKEWDVASGACIATLTGHSKGVTSAVYSYDGKKILSASIDQTIKEWDVASGACIATLTGHSSFVTSAVYSSDGKKILSVSYDQTIKEWDVASGVCLSTLTGHSSSLSSAVYSENKKKILSASDDHTIKEWDVASGACLATLTGHSSFVTSAVYSHDGKKILSTSADHTIKEWDVSSGACLSTLTGHSDWVYSAVYSYDGKKILSTSDDDTIKEWDVATGACLKTHNKNDHPTFPDYPTLDANYELKTDNNIIYLPDPNNKEEEKKLLNVPGLWMQGCSFENLEAGSQWTEKGLEILRMYGGKTGS